MRFAALLFLAALAGALVCAQDATSDPAQSTVPSEAETTSPAQRTTQEASDAAEKINRLKHRIEKGFGIAHGIGKKIREKVEGGKKIFKGGKKIFESGKKIFEGGAGSVRDLKKLFTTKFLF